VGNVVAFDEIKQIILPYTNWEEILEHCKRKLAGNYLRGESRVRKAYGLVAGIQNNDTLTVVRIFPLKRNVRDKEPYKKYMDRMMEKYAVPSKTPFSLRGWMTDPKELKELFDKCDRDEIMVFGTYHMHVVPWERDPMRDTPTLLDVVLARNSSLYSFIVSMVDITRPRIRGFYEGLKEKEVPILIGNTRFAKGV
jgi:hypothetical protein